MSQRRAIVDGVYQWVPEGPSYARVQAHGGRMVTADVAPRKRTPEQMERRRQINERYRGGAKAARQRELAGDPRPNTERCGVILARLKEPCARYAGHGANGHGLGHKSRLALDGQARTRRGAA